MKNSKETYALIKNAKHIAIIQAENPDGDSIGSALALEEILGELGKKVSLYCPVDVPKYLRYIRGWDRVTDIFPVHADIYIIVDTASKVLLEKVLIPENSAQLQKKPVIVIDHHLTKSDLPFKHTLVSEENAIATSEIIYNIAMKNGWKINKQAAENIMIALLSDSLGLSSEGTTAKSLRVMAELVDLGAHPSEIDVRRKEFMKKSPEILAYKGRLLERVEYHLEGKLALVHIPWEEITKYSDQYNPSMLVLDEMRLVTGVRIAIALKTYPDGKVTGKIRVNPDAKIAEKVAGFFGGGGHPFAAGFRTYEEYDVIVNELIGATDKILKEYDEAA